MDYFYIKLNCEVDKVNIKINIKKLIISVLVIVGIFVAGWIIFDTTSPHMVLQGEHLDIGSPANRVFGYENTALLVRNDGLMFVNRRGEEVAAINERFSFPFVSVTGRHILHAGRQGREAAVYRSLRELYRIETDGNIILARVNRNGYSVIVTEAMGFNGLVTVYNRRGEYIYRWWVGDGNIIDADIAPNNNEIAIVTQCDDNGRVSSVVTLVNIVRDEEIAVVRREDSLILSVQYFIDNCSRIFTYTAQI